VVSTTEKTSTCYAHPAVAAVGPCERCGRSLCDTCAFSYTGRGEGSRDDSFVRSVLRFCPDCMLAGAGQAKRGSLAYAMGSVGCLFGLVVVFVGGFALQGMGTVDLVHDKFAAGLYGASLYIFSLVGVSLGLIGRERSRLSGSPLALIGVIGNGLALALLLLMSFMAK
jgi:hypothetical protein